MKNKMLVYVLIALSGLGISCEKQKDILYSISPWVKYGSLKDVEGNSYRSIPIGNQTWMVDNLTTTKFNDGTPIPLVKDATSWSSLSAPACCWQNNDTARKVTYGVLYNWYTVKTGKLCPKGWHVPDDEEWAELVDFLGGENVAGGKLKESDLRHWMNPNSEASNVTHFWALPGGNRLNGPDALFDNLGKSGSWWTTKSLDNLAVNREMYYNSNNVGRSFYPKSYGMSVRCISDN
jgi:uncharacterized protein (TIGR02145 family)